jgi:hypothetical protein
MSEVKTLSPQEKKEQFIQSFVDRFEKELSGTSLTTTFMTCSDAPAFGWSVEENMYMPQVASRLREKGYLVTSKVNWGVTDWVIAV